MIDKAELVIINDLHVDEYNFSLGNYVRNLYFRFKINGKEIGSAVVQFTNEMWLEIDGANGKTLKESIHNDYNYELNWNKATLYEYLEDALCSLSFAKNDEYRGKTIGVLHEIEIYEEFRGKGHIKKFMMSLLYYLKEEKLADIIALQPHPFNDKRIDNDSIQIQIERLANLYRLFGFELVELPKNMNEKGNRYMQLFL